jgi:uncharacterized protein (DUF427 family)
MYPKCVAVICLDRCTASYQVLCCGPVLLFEPGLPVRYYIPRMDVRMALIELSQKTTHCAYKGTAPHFSVRLGDEVVEDIAWHYPFPNLQYAPIQNLICFYQERVADLQMDVDGERQTPRSSGG